MKKRGFGKDKFNGFGGKVNPNETIEEAVLRELYEEINVKAELEDIEKVGEITFIFPYVTQSKWNQIVHVFLIKNWDGEPIESEEMKPEWFNVEGIPFERMWQDDKHWLPLVLQNKLIKAKFVFNEDNESVKEMNIDEVKEL